MEEILSSVVDKYLDRGLGTIAFILLVLGIIYYAKSLRPLLVQMNTQSNTNEVLIKSSTEAVREIAKSNENVASALALLTTTVQNNTHLTNMTIELIQGMSTEIMKISERTTACASRK